MPKPESVIQRETALTSQLKAGGGREREVPVMVTGRVAALFEEVLMTRVSGAEWRRDEVVSTCAAGRWRGAGRGEDLGVGMINGLSGGRGGEVGGVKGRRAVPTTDCLSLRAWPPLSSSCSSLLYLSSRPCLFSSSSNVLPGGVGRPSLSMSVVRQPRASCSSRSTARRAREARSFSHLRFSS